VTRYYASGSWPGAGWARGSGVAPRRAPRRRRTGWRSCYGPSLAYARRATRVLHRHPRHRPRAAGVSPDRTGNCPKQPTYRKISPSDTARSTIAAYSCVEVSLQRASGVVCISATSRLRTTLTGDIARPKLAASNRRSQVVRNQRLGRAPGHFQNCNRVRPATQYRMRNHAVGRVQLSLECCCNQTTSLAFSNGSRSGQCPSKATHLNALQFIRPSARGVNRDAFALGFQPSGIQLSAWGERQVYRQHYLHLLAAFATAVDAAFMLLATFSISRSFAQLPKFAFACAIAALRASVAHLLFSPGSLQLWY